MPEFQKPGEPTNVSHLTNSSHFEGEDLELKRIGALDLLAELAGPHTVFGNEVALERDTLFAFREARSEKEKEERLFSISNPTPEETMAKERYVQALLEELER